MYTYILCILYAYIEYIYVFTIQRHCSGSVRKEPEGVQVPLRERETALRFRARDLRERVKFPYVRREPQRVKFRYVQTEPQR